MNSFFKQYLLVIGLCLMPLLTMAQNKITLTGKVMDESGEPLPGVAVIVSGSSNATITDIDGQYSLAAATGSVLEFTCLGYETKTVTVGQQAIINVTLKEESFALEETIVVGYGTQRKIDLTGSVEQVGSDVFASRPNANVSQMLEGAIPNLNISLADGKPIRSADYNVRGTTSIGQGGSALILIDGVEGDPAMINPDDIASVSVLKDAASSAIYGSRAPYGVVLITTKNAKKGRPVVTYSNNFTFSNPATDPKFVTDGFTWASMFYEGFWNEEGADPTHMNTIINFSKDWLREYRYRKDTNQLGTVISDGSWRVDAGNYAYFGEGTDWFDILYKDNAFAQTHNIALSGSTDKFDYYVSGRLYNFYGLYDSKINTDDCNSQNMRVKVGYKAFDWLRIYNNFEQGHRKYNNPFTSSGAAGNIWAQIQTAAPPCVPFYNPDGTMTKAAAYTVGGFLYGSSKSVYETDYIKNTVGFNATFLDNALTVNGDATYKLDDYNGMMRTYPDAYSPAPGVMETKPGVVSSILQDHSDKKYISLNFFADYTKTIDKHNIKGMLGYNYEQRTYSVLSAKNTDILTENVENINLALGSDNKTISGNYNKWRAVGIFTRINYNYDDRYLFQFNGRYDGSSKFPSNERWAFFPSASGAWRLSEEPWFKDNVSDKWVSNIKVRLSYGSLGNSNVDPYYYDESFAIGNSRLINGQKYRKTSAPDPIPDNLTWETSTTYNGGLDLGFFNDRLQVTADAYIRKTYDMFTAGPTIQSVYGADAPEGNYAELSTRGFELSVTWKDGFNLAGKPFNYSVKGTLADYTSTIDKYNNATGYIGGRNRPEYYEGMVIGELWGFVSNGLWQYQEDIDAANAKAQAAGQARYDSIHEMDKRFNIYPGDIKIEDLNGNGYIDRGDQTIHNPGDRTIIGNEEPRYIYSITLSADWNNFYGSIFFQGVGQRDLFTEGDSGMIWGQYNRPYNQIPQWIIGNYWTEDNRDAWMPRYNAHTEPFSQASRRANSRYLLDVSYIRLKNIQFGYHLPEKWLKPLKISKASVFFSGENLWDWSPMYKYVKNTVNVLSLGADPENSDTTAGTGGSYPVLSSYSFGISLTF